MAHELLLKILFLLKYSTYNSKQFFQFLLFWLPSNEKKVAADIAATPKQIFQLFLFRCIHSRHLLHPFHHLSWLHKPPMLYGFAIFELNYFD